jgi:hypothetical protein
MSDNVREQSVEKNVWYRKQGPDIKMDEVT